MARYHAGRETLHVKDLRFSRFMTPESLWVVPVEKVWESNTFFAPGVHNAAAAAASGKVRKAVLYHDIDRIQKKVKKSKKKAEQKQQQPDAEVLSHGEDNDDHDDGQQQQQQD